MKARMIKAECVQVGDRLVRQNVLGQDVDLLVIDVTPGDYMSIDYQTENGCQWTTHHFSDETITIVDETK